MPTQLTSFTRDFTAGTEQRPGRVLLAYARNIAIQRRDRLGGGVENGQTSINQC